MQNIDQLYRKGQALVKLVNITKTCITNHKLSKRENKGENMAFNTFGALHFNDL